MSLAIDQASHDDMREQLAQAEADAERLTAENARLRAALTYFRNTADADDLPEWVAMCDEALGHQQDSKATEKSSG